MKLITGYLGQDLQLEGRLSTSESLRIDCTYQGNVSSENMIIVGALGKIKGDIKDLKPENLEGYDAVLFLGGLSNDPMAMYRPDLNFVEIDFIYMCSM